MQEIMFPVGSACIMPVYLCLFLCLIPYSLLVNSQNSCSYYTCTPLRVNFRMGAYQAVVGCLHSGTSPDILVLDAPSLEMAELVRRKMGLDYRELCRFAMQRPDNPFLFNISCCSFRDELKKKQFRQETASQADSMSVQEFSNRSGSRKALMNYTSLGAGNPASAALPSIPLQPHLKTHAANSKFENLESDKMSKFSSRSRLSQASVEWERTRAAGSAAVDVTNLFLNPSKPSAINIWQVRRRHLGAAHDSRSSQ